MLFQVILVLCGLVISTVGLAWQRCRHFFSISVQAISIFLVAVAQLLASFIPQFKLSWQAELVT